MTTTISNLPPSMIQTIISLVPIQEAARTSILSKDWRYHWTKIPNLVFDEAEFQVSGEGDELTTLERSYGGVENQRRSMTKRCKFFTAIDRVLLDHEGPIYEFTLKMETDVTCVEINHIFSYLAKQNKVKKVTLVTAGGFKLPLSLFSLDQLIELRLSLCDFQRLPKFSGFPCLTSLVVDDVATSKSALLHLLSNCPSLKSLAMNTDAITRDDASTIPQLFESFPTVENLSAYLSAIESFSQYGVPRVLQASMVHLKHAYIDNMSFVPAYGLQIVLFLIRSSPNLEKLKLKILEDPAFVESQGCSFRPEDYPEILLEHLKVLEIFYLSNEKPEIDFVQFVIARSPVLEKVRIILFDGIDDDEELEITEILLGFARASPVVEIIVEKEVL